MKRVNELLERIWNGHMRHDHEQNANSFSCINPIESLFHVCHLLLSQRCKPFIEYVPLLYKRYTSYAFTVR